MKKDLRGIQARLQVEANAAAYGFRKIQDGHGKVRFVVRCSLPGCGKEDSMFHASLQDEQHLLTHFKKMGWVFFRKQAQYCSTQHEREAREQQRVERKEEELKQPIPQPVPAIQSNAKVTRRVIVALEEHFDDEKKLYRDGYSDERIAKEEDASIDFVKKYRRDAYGELAVDPEIAKLTEDIKAMEELFTSQLNTFSGQLQTLERSFAQQIGELKGRVDRLSKIHNKASG
jgi:hypothetical protein